MFVVSSPTVTVLSPTEAQNGILWPVALRLTVAPSDMVQARSSDSDCFSWGSWVLLF